MSVTSKIIEQCCVRTHILDEHGNKFNQGTGVIVFDNSSYYVLTADHCIYGDKSQYSYATPEKILLEVQEAYDSPFRRLSVSKIFANNREFDWVMLQIEDPQIKCDFSMISKGKNVMSDVYVKFCGYQNFNANQYRPWTARILTTGKNQFRIKIANDTFQQGGDSGSMLAMGLSGSGVFIANGEALCLIGILKSVITDRALNDDIDCCMLSNLHEALASDFTDVSRLNAVEVPMQVSDLIRELDSLRSGVEHIKTHLGGFELDQTYRFPRSEAPPLVQRLSRRADLASQIISRFKEKEFIFITGSIATGKTQLSALIYAQQPGDKAWIGLKGTTPSNFVGKINRELQELESHILKKGKSIAFTLLVVDDMPRLERTDPQLNDLIYLLLSAKQRNIKFLITSNYTLPSQVRDLLPDQQVEQIQIPFLTIDETSEVLESYGASRNQCDDFKAIVHTVSNGHPTITTAVCKFLKSSNWSSDHEQLGRLFKDDYSLDLTEETYSDILRTIEDGQTRELLYRLKLIKRSFTTQHVILVAQTDPPISAPLERFNSITGLWIQRTSNDSYQLSPLIERLRDENLNNILARKINYELGLQLLSKRKLNQFEGTRAIQYFLAAEASDMAAFILIVALNDALKNPEIFFDWGFGLYWTDTELPRDMDVTSKIYIRMLQLMLFMKRESEFQALANYVRDDLERILVSTDPSRENYSYASLFLSAFFSKDNSSKALKYFSSGVQSLAGNSQSNLRHELEKVYSPEQLIWTSTRAIAKEKHVDEWFVAFKSLPIQRRVKALELDEVRMAATFITENLINAEEKLSSTTQNWEGLISVLERIRNEADALGIKIMVARAIKAMVYVYSSKLNSLEEARKIGDSALAFFENNDRECRFLVSDALGRELFYKGKTADAKNYLQEAVAIEVDEFYTDKLDTFIVMSQVVAEQDKDLAHHYVGKALEFVQDEYIFSDTQRIKVRAEYAISLSFINRIDEAIIEMEKGYDMIFTLAGNLPDYKILMLRYQHVINYWHSKEHKKKEPDNVDGSPYQAPHRGYFFVSYTPEYVEQNWFEERPFIGANLLLSCFEYIGDVKMAEKWAVSSIVINKATARNALALIGHAAVPYFILSGRYDEALELEFSLLQHYNTSAADATNVTNDRFKRLLESAPWPRKGPIEYDELIIVQVIIPTVLRLLTLLLQKASEFTKNLHHALATAERWETIFNNRDAIQKIVEMLKSLENDSVQGQAFVESVQSYQGSFAAHVKTVGYLIGSVFTPSSQSFLLHAALIKGTAEASKHIGLGSYKFILVPFLENFWFKRVEDSPSDIEEMGFWVSRSLPFYRKSPEDQKVKALFKILRHHLKNITVPQSLDDWIDQ